MNAPKSSFGKRLSRFILVISAIGLGLVLLAEGMMSLETLIIFLFVAVIAAVIDSTWVHLILAMAGIVFFLIEYTGYNAAELRYLATGVLALLLALLGIFVILGGLRKR